VHFQADDRFERLHAGRVAFFMCEGQSLTSPVKSVPCVPNVYRYNL
jgi:hypothetical protein